MSEGAPGTGQCQVPAWGQFQRLLLDDPHAPIHRFLDRNKAQQFYAWSKDYGKLLDAGLLFADQLPDEILPSGMRCMVWNSLLASRRAGGISDQVFLFDPGRAGVLSGEFFSSGRNAGGVFYGGIHDGLKGTLFGKKQRDTQKE